MEQMVQFYADRISEGRLEKLGIDRELPVAVLKKWMVGWSGKSYTIPSYDEQKRVCDIKLYDINGRFISTPGASAGLFGLNKYDPQYKRIYICEGEWDTMALDMLAGELGKKYNIVGVPGASTFKPEWLELFRDKEVVSLYDNDEAGEKGEVNAQKRLAGIAESMWFVHWPVDAPTGFDVRDWIRYGLKIEKPIGCWKNLHTLLKSEPRIISIAEKVVIRQQSTIEGTASIEDVFRTYKKWLHSEHDRPDAITIAFAVCMANRLEGDPVWLFFVGPPGSMKSELLMSLSDHTTVYATTSLTTKTLISGAPTFSAKDPSLIPQLNGKILICKDFTSILTMQYMVRD